jgi:hypothetical protein
MNFKDIIFILLQTVIPLYLCYLIRGLKHEIESQKQLILTQKQIIDTIKDNSNEILSLKDLHKKFSEDIYAQTQIYKKIMDEQVIQLRAEVKEKRKRLNAYRSM